MIKLTFCLTRLSHLSRDDFQDYWFRSHAPLVARHRKTLRIERYVQLHSGDPGMSEAIRASRGGPEQYDGVAQLWWRSFDDLAAVNADPRAVEAGRELLEDEKRFIDLSRSPLWFGEEKVIFG
jgi:hypothetical protein